MEGPALGAPRLINASFEPAEDVESDITSLSPPSQVVVEATPVSSSSTSRNVPVVYAESTPLSFKQAWRGKGLRGSLFIVLVVVVVGAVACVLIFQMRGADPKDGAISTDASSAPTSAPSFLLDDVLRVAYEYSGPEALEAPNSPQLKAVWWLSSRDMVNLDDDEALLQRYAMVTFAFSLNVDQWFDPENWLNPTEHECNWSDGISCGDDIAEHRIVTGIDATRNGLSGEIPFEVCLLPRLKLLRMPTNPMVTGALPSGIGT
jgi:hypothetical protein